MVEGKRAQTVLSYWGDLYTDDQEQNGKQSISRLPQTKSVPGVLLQCPRPSELPLTAA